MGRAPIKHTNAMVRLEDIISDDNWGHGRIIGQTSDENPGLPTKHAIDLIEAFDNYLKCNFKRSGSDSKTSSLFLFFFYVNITIYTSADYTVLVIISLSCLFLIFNLVGELGFFTLAFGLSLLCMVMHWC